jgi:ATP phosphoribosyltransferase regulatory subunit HisZ
MSGTQDQMAQAQAVLFDEVYLPAFRSKCAAYGLQFPDDESLQSALESVVMLKAAESSEQTNITKSAADALRSALKLPKTEDVVAQQERAAQEKQASEQLSRDQQIRQAIDALANASSGS